MTDWRLQSPLWLLLCLPVLAAIWWSMRRRRQAAMLYSSVDLLRGLPVTFATRVKRMLPGIRAAGVVLAVMALARPQQGLQEFRIRTEGIAIQMCLDRSGSMQAMDFELDHRPVNRLTAVKQVFRDFVAGRGELPGRPDDLIGLISFGGFAEALAPLTLDHGALLQVLETVDIPQPIRDARGRVINGDLLEEEMATAIGDAVTLAIDRLKDAKAKSKVIILLSDGEQTAGIVEPEKAAEAAKAFGIKIYAIGVGTTGRAPFPAVDATGRELLVPRFVRLDEATLKAMASTTGGEYFNAQDTRALVDVYAEIDRLEKTLTEGRLYTEYRELYLWFLLPGLGLILLESALSATRFRSLP
ncbi:MAG: VWA domain-containing protein [Planctomycetes bacterium]|nr:VWA domain-containing protein [Planctomycetota bacterium]